MVAAIALAPWVKNRGLINDFYDYGVTISAVGRIADGERPYRDFVSPIQTGGFILNGLSEAVFGATFRGMTTGAGILIVASTALLTLLLAQRLSISTALILSGALVWSAVCQHTIIWYNSVGVLCLAVVGWAGALAPVLRRESVVLNGLLAGALFVGGINKASFQIIAVVIALAWVLRAGLLGKASWRRVWATIGYVVGAGIVLPILFEVLWTGVSLSTWWYNVVALPGGGRSQDLAVVLSPRFYLEHHHNYYGYLPVPWVGLLGLIMSVWVLVQGWVRMSSGSLLDRLLFTGAVMLAVGAGVALLATNKEIAYISFAGWAVLLIAVWLGFGLSGRSWPFIVGLMCPCAVMGIFGWQAAWRGQRALWGYSPHPKSAYVAGDSVGPDFAYLRGTRIPPDWVASLDGLADEWAKMTVLERSQLFYGSGTEWLERVWSARKVKGIPLFLDYGTSYSSREMLRLRDAIGPEGEFRRITLTVQRDVWFGESRQVIERNYVRKKVGPIMVLYERGESDGVSIHPLDYIGKHGGNVDSNLIKSRMEWHTLSDGRFFLGTSEGVGELELSTPLRRFRGEMVLKRSTSFGCLYPIGDRTFRGSCPFRGWPVNATMVRRSYLAGR